MTHAKKDEPIKLLVVVGARPNFIKAAAFLRAVGAYNHVRGEKHIDTVLLHTGQHYDHAMSQAIFMELNIPQPDYNLGIGRTANANHVGKTMDALHRVYLDEAPDWVVVFGDTSSTLAAALTARMLGVRLCHIEAGLRCGDMTMPEEVNRVLTDTVADLLLAPTAQAAENLHSDRDATGRVKHVGNIMIDAMDYYAEHLREPQRTDHYCLLTLHRASNVDVPHTLSNLVYAIKNTARANLDVQFLWPMHPRTEKQLARNGYSFRDCPNIIILPPASYLGMLGLLKYAKVITDSGGLQAESTVAGVPCLTVRDTIEWTETLTENGGTAVLAKGSNLQRLFGEAITKPRKPYRPLLWDGCAADRCVLAIVEYTT